MQIKYLIYFTVARRLLISFTDLLASFRAKGGTSALLSGGFDFPATRKAAFLYVISTINDFCAQKSRYLVKLKSDKT